MALIADQLATSMTAALPQALQAAQITAGNLVADINKFAPNEIKKLASQLVAIEQGGFSEPLAKIMLKMQVDAFINVLIGMTDATMYHVQQLINELLKIVAGVVNGALNFALL